MVQIKLVEDNDPRVFQGALVGVCVVGIVADVIDGGVEIAGFVFGAGANFQPVVGRETDRLVVVDEHLDLAVPRQAGQQGFRIIGDSAASGVQWRENRQRHFVRVIENVPMSDEICMSRGVRARSRPKKISKLCCDVGPRTSKRRRSAVRSAPRSRMSRVSR